jgi:hypothetical protein
LHNIFCFLAHAFFSAYLFENIRNIGNGGTAYNVLLLTAIISLLAYIYQTIKPNSQTYLRVSIWFLMLFLIYLALSLTFTSGSGPAIKEILIGTTGGTFLFFYFGAFLSFSIFQSHQKANDSSYISTQNILFAVFLILYVYNIYLTLLQFTASLATDKFLLLGIAGAYQRVGNFLTISFIQIAALYYNFIITNKLGKHYIISILKIILTLGFCLCVLSCSFLAQVMMSNNSLVSINFIALAVLVAFLLKSVEKNKYLRVSKFSSFFIGSLAKSIFFSGVRSIVILGGLFLLTVWMLQIDLNRFRIFGFGKGRSSSLEARADLLQNFPIHFDYSPLFGNMLVDDITTGTGTYVHSFTGSILTHLGIVGFLIFFTYLYVAIFEKFRYPYKDPISNRMNIFTMLLFIGFFMLASIATFFSWIPIWYVLGLAFPPIITKKV